MLKISWKDKVTNMSVLEKVKEEERMLNILQYGNKNANGWSTCL